MSSRRGQCSLSLSRETLSAWRDRVLPDAETQRIAQHVQSCLVCQARLGQFTRIAAAVQRQPTPDLRAETWRGIQTRLMRTTRRPTPLRPRLRRAVAFGRIGVTALVAALIVLFALVFSHRPTPISGTGTPGSSPTASATTAPACPTFPAGYRAQLPDPGYTSTNVYANIPLPPQSRIVPNNASGGVRGYDVCTAGTVAAITTFMSDHLTALGWSAAGGGVWTKDGYHLTLRIASATDWTISWRDPDHF